MSRTILSALLLIIVSALPVMAETNNATTPWGVDAAGFKNLSTALSSPVTAGKTVLVTRPMEINSHATNRDLQILPGGRISINAGKTLTVNGSFSAGPYQVFAGGGNVLLSRSSVSRAEWFGLKGNGSDETAVIQKTINAIKSGEAQFPAGIFKGNVVMKTEVTVTGVTSATTIFIPALNAPVFTVSQATSNVRFGWKRLTIDGSATKAAFTRQDGISIIPGAGMWADTVTLEDVVISHCGRYGWHSFGSSGMGPFVQRLVMTKVLTINNVREGIFLDGDHFEVNFRDVWATQNGDKTTYSNAYIGNKSAPHHSVHRLNWIGGGITQTLLNAASRMVTDASISAGTRRLTSRKAAFSAADVGTPVVLSTIGISNNPAFITTIVSRLGPDTVTLADVAPVTVSSGTAIINTPVTGGLHISHGSEVNLIGIEFEECGAFIIADGSLSRSINIIGSAFISNKPSIAALWVRDNMQGRVSLRGWSLYTTGPVLWGALSSLANGTLNGAVTGLDVETPFSNGQIVNGLTSVYDYDAPSAGVYRFSRTGMPLIRVSGTSGPLHTITDAYGVSTGYAHGQQVTIVLWGPDPLTVRHDTGNILLNGATDFVMRPGPGKTPTLTLIWDTISKKWIEISRSA